MVIVPVLLPTTVGTNFTVIVQLAPAATVLQLFVWVKSPLAEMLLMLRNALPVFVIVNACPRLVVLICCEAKTKLEGDNVTSGPVAVLQVPLAGAIPVPPLNSYAPISMVPTRVRPSAQAG
jgi:hypothetical protein